MSDGHPLMDSDYVAMETSANGFGPSADTPRGVRKTDPALSFTGH